MQGVLTYREPTLQSSRVAPSEISASQAVPCRHPLAGASQAPPDALTAAATLVGFAGVPSQPQLPALPVSTRVCNTLSREEGGGRSGSGASPRRGFRSASGRTDAQSLTSTSPQHSIRDDQRRASRAPTVGRGVTGTRVAGSGAAGASVDVFWRNPGQYNYIMVIPLPAAQSTTERRLCAKTCAWVSSSTRSPSTSPLHADKSHCCS